MSVYKRAGVWWYDFTIATNRYRQSTDQTSKAAAVRVEARARELAKLGTSHSAIPSIQEAADRWFAARAKDRRSSMTTAVRLKVALRHIDSNLPVTEVRTSHIEEAVQSRRFDITHNGRPPTNGTVNRDIIDSTLRPILNYCADVLELPMRKIAWAKVRLVEPKGRNRPLTPADIAAWRGALPAHHRPLFDFMALYGVRLREAFFAPEAVDPIEEEVTITGRKNGVDLILYLLAEDAADLAAKATRAKVAGLSTVWYKDVGGALTPIHPRGFQSASRSALEAVGLTGLRPAHDLRHHAGSAIRRAGDVTLAQMLLGHEDLASTTRYAHPDKVAMRTALRHVKVTNAVSDDNSSTISMAITGT